ncbi:MAG: hypothetical protein HWE27_14255 [Gammaproteobacteria bacterium]|nr:hypothetical protein [Gammaproteobacteria bacterium]
MKYKISKKFIKSKKREPIYSLLWTSVMGLFIFAFGNVPWYVALTATIFLIATVSGLKWFGLKNRIESLENHFLEIEGSELNFVDKTMTSKVDMNNIYRLTLDKRRDNVTAVYIEPTEGQRLLLAPYENFNHLVDVLLSLVPSEKVNVRKWLHF